MAIYLQGSLFDETDEVGLGPLDPVSRTVLSHDAWIDVRRGWVRGADALFEVLARRVPWQAERRHMYDREVDVPRLLSFYDADDTLPHPILAEARQALSEHYAAELGEPFVTAGLCYYRDGRDSVAWHADRELRELDDTRVAILTLGARRPFLLRPKGGGKSRNLAPASGDLLVMGGACQMRWQHSVPKVKRAGPRISCTWRWTNTTPKSEPA
jgi:alkylated DNA repair dioxygenase AlkB